MRCTESFIFTLFPISVLLRQPAIKWKIISTLSVEDNIFERGEKGFERNFGYTWTLTLSVPLSVAWVRHQFMVSPHWTTVWHVNFYPFSLCDFWEMWTSECAPMNSKLTGIYKIGGIRRRLLRCTTSTSNGTPVEWKRTEKCSTKKENCTQSGSRKSMRNSMNRKELIALTYV